ncbi:PREDICTED: IAA-alanine resistance protein 1 [Nelumbo nucifera]|uniref:IAA-alanine resistance protein 1 n=1 Tax=Nelumbo nucifera TaxID=4432 RepID=A0A1U8AT01_NELNU|nr:PREDICTED: IAA-alanine resistance protein 1 [Nelumbo nucifera]
MAGSWMQRGLVLILVTVLGLKLCLGHEGGSESCPFSQAESSDHHHCEHDHHLHHHHHHHENEHRHHHGKSLLKSKLPEELAEEEDLKLLEHESHHGHRHDHDHEHGISDLSGIELWIHAMGCSLLVSMASLICLIILPVILLKGKPSKAVVDSLAVFGAGAMLGDAFLHQLPHAFGGEHSHSHDHHMDHSHDHHHFGHTPSHSHSLKDLFVGLSVLSGIVLFLLVEKVVRYVEDHSRKGAYAWGHGHHHHHHPKNSNKLKDDQDGPKDLNSGSIHEKNGNELETSSEGKVIDQVSGALNVEKENQQESVLRKRITTSGGSEAKPDSDFTNGKIALSEKGSNPPSNLVFGYLNLFSDGVHNFTDGMALGSAFLLYGSVGGWSRTLFLLAHELPQEVGDFGILVRSGFSAPKALFFNFLSALVALAGTALALLVGKDPGQSSLIEGFTAGGFIYIAVAGVLPEMNSGSSTCKSTMIQLVSLILGMAVALCISLVE